MKTTIDKAGRVVIPAPIRQRAGLVEGTELEVLTRGVGPKAMIFVSLDRHDHT